MGEVISILHLVHLTNRATCFNVRIVQMQHTCMKQQKECGEITCFIICSMSVQRRDKNNLQVFMIQQDIENAYARCENLIAKEIETIDSARKTASAIKRRASSLLLSDLPDSELDVGLLDGLSQIPRWI